MMTFTSEQLATLRKIAQQATQGEWRAFISPDTGTYAVHTPGDERCGDIIKWPGFDGQKNAENNAEFIAAFNPKLVQTLLDERERNQQYIKRRDQENEEIALTVGKLRVELEAAENNLIDSECHVAELEEALRDKQALLEASEKRIAELEAELVSQTYKLNELSGNSPVTPDGWISCSERMPNDAQWCVVNTKYGYYVQCWSEGQGWLGDDISIPECDVINWMPLPEPPQEMK
ncbi:TPA: ead/Ea22-like family protein [Escherichia coli]